MTDAESYEALLESEEMTFEEVLDELYLEDIDIKHNPWDDADFTYRAKFNDGSEAKIHMLDETITPTTFRY